jgi:hypothetical protein
MINKTKLKEQRDIIELIGVRCESQNNSTLPRTPFNDDVLKSNITIKDDCVERLFESKPVPFIGSNLSFTEANYDSENSHELNEWSDDDCDKMQTKFETKLQMAKMTVHWTELHPDSSPTESLFKALGNKYLNNKSSSDV